MRRLQIYKELRRHRKLAESRSVNLSQNKIAKYILFFVFFLAAVYLIFIAIMLALIANNTRTMTSVEFICGIAPFLLALDFIIRFSLQQTPAQMIKPYVLLPIRRYACINAFVVKSLLSSSNLVWFAMLIPYSIMSILFSHGIPITILTLLLFLLLIMANSQWYAIVRTLVNDTIGYWILPILIYAAIFSPAIIHGGDFGQAFDFYAQMGTRLSNGNPTIVITAAGIMLATAFINRNIQYTHIMQELGKSSTSSAPHSTVSFSFLDKYGEIGQYIQLETKLILRNKNPRKTFIFATVIVAAFSMIIAFSDIYDSTFMTYFWCIYNFLIYGVMGLVRIMCNEGNYMDCLMTRKENILTLLKAKYITYSILLGVPFLLTLPVVIVGKWSILMLLSFMLFTMGFQYFVLFQMAIYNKQSSPLNTKFISKSNIENNYMQLIVELVNFACPMILVSILQTFLSETWTYVILMFIGCGFVATNNLWLRNIYVRLMRRRYTNMESFRASR